MAKNEKQAEANTEATATTEAKASQGRSVILTLDAEAATAVGAEAGASMSRVDYIRARWASKSVGRGDIAKEVSRLQGKTVPYQIVFQATKGHEGGPVKAAEPKAAEGGDTAAA